MLNVANAKGYPQFSRSSLGTPGTIASHADALRGSSRVPFPREEGTRDEPITASAWEATGTMTHQFRERVARLTPFRKLE